MTGSKTKACKTCGETKPASEFYSHPNTRDKLHMSCKECVRAKTRAHHAANKERLREYNKRPERLKAAAARARAHYAANRERKMAYQRAYAKAHPEVGRRAWRERRARQFNAPSEPYSRREIYDRDEGLCRGCGCALPFTGPPSVGGFHVDHIWPLSADGGTDLKNNLQTLCPRCNREKGARTDWVPSRPRLF